MVYIREAHAADSSWPVGYAKKKGIKNHKNYKDRCMVADVLYKEKKLSIPGLIDNMDNKVNDAYKGHPTRIFLIRRDGKLGVAGKRGPWGLRPAFQQAQEWMKIFKETGKEPPLKTGSN